MCPNENFTINWRRKSSSRGNVVGGGENISENNSNSTFILLQLHIMLRFKARSVYLCALIAIHFSSEEEIYPESLMGLICLRNNFPHIRFRLSVCSSLFSSFLRE
jgi:hypothetical protein